MPQIFDLKLEINKRQMPVDNFISMIHVYVKQNLLCLATGSSYHVSWGFNASVGQMQH